MVQGASNSRVFPISGEAKNGDSNGHAKEAENGEAKEEDKTAEKRKAEDDKIEPVPVSAAAAVAPVADVGGRDDELPERQEPRAAGEGGGGGAAAGRGRLRGPVGV